MATYSSNFYPEVDMYEEHRAGPTTYHGNISTMLTGGIFSAAEYTTRDKYRAAIMFDLTALPTDKNITKAILHLNKYTGNNETIYAIESSTSFTESSGPYGWNSGVYSSFMTNSGWCSGSVLSNLLWKMQNGSFDNENKRIAFILSNVLDFYSPTSNVTGFYTKESSNKPYLEIEYEDIPPSPPTNLAPSGLNQAYDSDILFSWSNSEEQSKFDLQYSIDDGTNWTTVTETTSTTSYTLPANTFTSSQTIVWKVRIYSINDVVGAYSSQATFQVEGKPPTPVITNTETITTPHITATWTSTEQTAYRVVIDGVYDTYERTGTGTSFFVPVALNNNTPYTIKVSVKNTFGIWSDEAVKVVNVAFQEPSQPIMQLITSDINGFIEIRCIKTTGPVATDTFDIFRKEVGGSFERIATNISDKYHDYTIKSSTEYIYKIRAIASNLAYKDSSEASRHIILANAQLAHTDDYNRHIDMKYNITKKISYDLNKVDMYFAGREKAVSEFGEHKIKNISISFTVLTEDEVEDIIDFVYSKGTFLYRDNRGRKMYCTVGIASVTDVSIGSDYLISLTANEVDFSEVV
ncbi:hypothetical protein HZI73_22330 [Vallitalea pronyensis]|uniref:Fibronectin type-III domain-containing protein n=1 Tax=Vallitalea pronyensis TaxID=1348613 RepID=A0A8J8SIW7_9FIRM|nr:hypothetical protein [Vallitalea pronyensis]QUI24869.1 hypothetical protein HZI73_22330 [Vallitalea pronyensis]